MPLYLVHGFRWPRRAIRIHIILENLDDCAAEYLAAPATHSTMYANFKTKFPEEMKLLPKLRFIEQYDPNDTSSKALSQPYAYVVDKVQPLADLSFDVKTALEEAEGKMNSTKGADKQIAAMQKLKEQLANDEKSGVGWWVIYNGDERRVDGLDEKTKKEEKVKKDDKSNVSVRLRTEKNLAGCVSR